MQMKRPSSVTMEPVVEEIDFSPLWVITASTISLIKNVSPGVLSPSCPHIWHREPANSPLLFILRRGAFYFTQFRPKKSILHTVVLLWWLQTAAWNFEIEDNFSCFLSCSTQRPAFTDGGWGGGDRTLLLHKRHLNVRHKKLPSLQDFWQTPGFERLKTVKNREGKNA